MVSRGGKEWVGRGKVQRTKDRAAESSRRSGLCVPGLSRAGLRRNGHVKKEIHYHRHLASAGKLEKLEVVSRPGYKVILSGFKGALLCFNEKRTQLYVEGGDQAVDLQQFGIEPGEAHEMEVLGEVRAVEYFTTKDHLGSEGGTAIYRHKFEKPYPELQYDVRNEQLIFSGGKYVILPEGIDK